MAAAVFYMPSSGKVEFIDPTVLPIVEKRVVWLPSHNPVVPRR